MKYLSIISVWGIIIISLYGVTFFKVINPILLPYPHEIIFDVIASFDTKDFWIDFSSTLSYWGISVILGALAGIAFGIVASIYLSIWRAFWPILEFFRSLPSIVLVPIVALFFGSGMTTKIFASFIVVFPIVALSVGSALRGFSTDHRRVLHAYQPSGSFVLRSIFGPYVMGSAIVGLRAGVPIALIVVVAADMLVATETGLGRRLLDNLAVFDMSKAYSIVLVIGVLGIIASYFGAALEKHLAFWHGR